MSKAKLTPQQRYNRLWRKVGSSYGGGAAPTASFGKTSIGGTKGAAYPGGVEVGRGTTKQLTSRDPAKRKAARYVLLHEWSHATKGTGEGGANRDANVISTRLNKQQNQRLKVKKSKNPGVIERKYLG